MATPRIVSPDAADKDELQRFAGRLKGLGETPRLVGPRGESLELPVAIYEVLVAVADDLRRGYSVTIMSLGAVLTTAQAAELLNVSRPHVVKLIDEGQIPHHMAGSHRRVALADLLRYKEQRDRARNEALAKMHQVADEAGMDL